MLFMFITLVYFDTAPYVEPSMNWWPIIIALSVTGPILLIVAILICCAFCKRQQRKQENFRRRDSLQRSLRASKASIAASNMNLSHDVILQKKRRPPLAETGDSFMNLSGATLDETNTDILDKPHLDFHRPITPASTLDYSSTKHLDSSYFDSDLGPNRRHHYDIHDSGVDRGVGQQSRQRHDSYDDDPKASRGYTVPVPQRPQYDIGPGGYKKPRPMLGSKPSSTSSCNDRPYRPSGAMNYPLTLENEIAHVSAQPVMYRNQAYNDRSLDHSHRHGSDSDSVRSPGLTLQYPGSRPQYPAISTHPRGSDADSSCHTPTRRLPLTSSRTSIDERPKPKETDM